MKSATSQDEKITMLLISLSAIISIWTITSMISLTIASHLVTKNLNLEIATQHLTDIVIKTDTLSLWTGISLASNLLFLYLAVRVTINAIRHFAKPKGSD